MTEQSLEVETINKCAENLLAASLNIEAWRELPPFVGVMAMMIKESVAKISATPPLEPEPREATVDKRRFITSEEQPDEMTLAVERAVDNFDSKLKTSIGEPPIPTQPEE